MSQRVFRSRTWVSLYWAFAIAVSILILSPVVFHGAPQSGGAGYRVIRNIQLGAEGGWDYITVDPENKRLYSPRSEDIQVVDEVSGKIVGDITGMKGVHGIAVAPEFNRGFVTGNEGPEAEIYLVDLKAMKVTDKIALPGAKGSDSLMYDAFSKRAFINTAASDNAQAVDAATGKLVGSVTLPGRPEAAVPDGKGSMFVNIVDKDMMAEYDVQKLAVKNTYPNSPCIRGVGLAMDTEHRRLFIGCQNTGFSGILEVMNADNGKVVGVMPIGVGVDGVAYDPGTGDIFATCRDDGNGVNGATWVFHEDTPDKYSKVAQVQTIYGARTVAIDTKTHRVFSEATEKNNPPPNMMPTADNPHPRLVPVANTFAIVEIGK